MPLIVGRFLLPACRLNLPKEFYRARCVFAWVPSASLAIKECYQGWVVHATKEPPDRPHRVGKGRMMCSAGEPRQSCALLGSAVLALAEARKGGQSCSAYTTQHSGIPSSQTLALVVSLPTLVKTVQEALSWREIVAMEISARASLDANEYEKFLEECEKRLWELYNHGTLPKSSLLAVVAHQPQGGYLKMLYLVVGCGTRLAESGFFSLTDMSEFLLALCQHPGRGRAHCGRLQSVVDIFEANMDEMSSKDLLGGLFAASRIAALKVCTLMVGVENLYGDRLDKLSGQEMNWLLAASRRISYQSVGYDGRPLCLKFLTEHFLLLRTFPPQHCVEILIGLTFAFGQDHHFRELLFQGFDIIKDLLPCVVTSLGIGTVARLSVAMAILGLKYDSIPFPDFFVARMECLSPNKFVQMFHYVVKNYNVDSTLLERTLTYSSKLRGLNGMFISLFLSALTFPHIHSNPVTEYLALATQREICEQVSRNPGSFSPGECANFFLRFTLLQIDGSPIQGILFENAVLNVGLLSLQEFIWLVRGAGYMKQNPERAHAVQKAMQKVPISAENLTVFDCMSLCKGFVGMHLVEPVWLEEIAQVCRQNISKLFITPMLLYIVHRLCYLGFRHQALFMDIGKVLEAQTMADSTALAWKEMINLLWACVWHDVYPEKALSQLSRLEISSALDLPGLSQQNLHQVILLVQQKCGKNLLHSETYAALLEARVKQQPPFSGITRQCLLEIADLLPKGHVRQNVEFAEGWNIGCTILKDKHGQTMEWPYNFPSKLSVEDVRSLVAHGYLPVAVLVLGRRHFDYRLVSMLGTVQMMCHVLSSGGWSVLVIPTEDYKVAVDKQAVLCSKLRKAGICMP